MDKERDLYQELKDYDYNLYIKTIEKAELLTLSLENKYKVHIRDEIEKCLVEFALQVRNKY